MFYLATLDWGRLGSFSYPGSTEGTPAFPVPSIRSGEASGGEGVGGGEEALPRRCTKTSLRPEKPEPHTAPKVQRLKPPPRREPRQVPAWAKDASALDAHTRRMRLPSPRESRPVARQRARAPQNPRRRTAQGQGRAEG